ncbi:MAG: TetR/AcrR family transcriptional regulator [Christensenellales bacterium]
MNDRKAAIYKSAKEVFEKKGFRDSGVAEIMERAGMATGTFYNYYPSKDTLFMQIFSDENVKLKNRLLAQIDTDADPISVMREVMIKNRQGMLENPILREWYNRDVFQKIERNFREENHIEQVDFLYDRFIVLIEKWQRERKLRSDISAGMIMALFGAVISVEMHKEEIGLQFFPQLIMYMVEFIMKGLMEGAGDASAAP